MQKFIDLVEQYKEDNKILFESIVSLYIADVNFSVENLEKFEQSCIKIKEIGNLDNELIIGLNNLIYNSTDNFLYTVYYILSTRVLDKEINLKDDLRRFDMRRKYGVARLEEVITDERYTKLPKEYKDVIIELVKILYKEAIHLGTYKVIDLKQIKNSTDKTLFTILVSIFMSEVK